MSSSPLLKNSLLSLFKGFLLLERICSLIEISTLKILNYTEKLQRNFVFFLTLDVFRKDLEKLSRSMREYGFGGGVFKPTFWFL